MEEKWTQRVNYQVPTQVSSLISHPRRVLFLNYFVFLFEQPMHLHGSKFK